MKKYYVILILLSVVCKIESQSFRSDSEIFNKKFENIAYKADESGWIFFKKEIKLSPDDIVSKHKNVFELRDYDEMKQIKIKSDNLGSRYITFQQYYKGLIVEYFSIIVHEKDGVVQSANGEILSNIEIDIKPLLLESDAFEIAIGSFKTNLWAWEDKDWENEKTSDRENPTWKPKGELMIIKIGKASPVLVYKFNLLSIDPYFEYSIYINASNGTVEKKKSLMQSANGTVNTLYNGYQSFTTLYRGLPNWDYILKDETRGYICTKIYNGTPWNLRQHIDNHENHWHDTTNTEVQGATVQWTAEKAYDYFHNAFYRHGIDNNNLDLRIQIWPALNKSAWTAGGSDYDLITIGTYGELFNGSLDIMGHEFTHGVTASEAGLISEMESGALNESFSDIFGTMIERSVESSSWNWTIGEDIFNNDYLRSLSNPNDKYHAATYLTDNYWIDVTNCTPTEENDYCGIYNNAGVQNLWFYLLSNGGTFNNITVTGIGTENAEKIAYYNLCFNLSYQSGYLSARNGSLLSAASLFGECSNEYNQVMNAWAAVGVGLPSTPCIVAHINGPNYLSYGEVGYWNSSVSGGSGNYNYTWYVDGSYYSNNPSINYAFYPYETSYYPIYLTVSDGILGDNDELLVTVYPEQMNLIPEANDLSIDLFPNPAVNETLVVINSSDAEKYLEENEIVIIYIVDNNGRVLRQSNSKSKSILIDTSNLENGIYKVIISFKGQRISKSLIINK